VAHYLLARLPVWLALDGDGGDPDPLERVLPQLEAVARFADELRSRVAADGIDGIDGMLNVHRRLRAVLDDIPRDELERMRGAVAELTRALEDIARCLDHMARIKALVRKDV